MNARAAARRFSITTVSWRVHRVVGPMRLLFLTSLNGEEVPGMMAVVAQILRV